MRIIGGDLHARQQTLAMLDTETGEVVNRTLLHQGNEVREFYSKLPHRKLGIRLWIMLRDQIDYEEFCRRG